MSSEPLSVLIEQFFSRRDEAIYHRFVVEFSRAVVGVISVGMPEGITGRVESTSRNPLTLGSSVTPDGQTVLLTFADPAIFIQRYGARFNAEMNGIDVFRTVEANPDCGGVQVNSALGETSLIIPREGALSMLRTEAATNKPWWKFWL
jgi:hypothetical protein